MVTGDAGFRDSAVVRHLQEAGETDIFVPKVEDYDLRTLTDIGRTLAGRADSRTSIRSNPCLTGLVLRLSVARVS
jgi:hypothetical protein